MSSDTSKDRSPTPGPMPEQTIVLNRRARHEYAIDETLEAGIVLTGTEIKSIRAGGVNLRDAYGRAGKGGAGRTAAPSPPYGRANGTTQSPRRPGKCRCIRPRTAGP